MYSALKFNYSLINFQPSPRLVCYFAHAYEDPPIIYSCFVCHISYKSKRLLLCVPTTYVPVLTKLTEIVDLNNILNNIILPRHH